MVAPQKLGTLGKGKRSDGATEVRQILRALNKTYEESITVGTSPKVHSFNVDFGYNAIKGWIICDGEGQMKVEFSRDGIIFGEIWTMRPGERTDLDALDIHTLRITFVAVDSDYRIWQA